MTKQGAAATLSSLELSLGALNFSPWRTEYSIYVGNNVDRLSLTPVSTSSFYDHMTINGSPHVTGTAYNVSLAVGDNPVTIAVASKEQREMVYTVHITRLEGECTAGQWCNYTCRG
ncbi:cadherin-like beta sandwich domain-containing protein [Paenibacillus sp. Soil766]|uniref:cadherin-like beta sandwich domain-containing protein n=1 Tax=Paenibacillus sp. Soil766 TaxID=1736404 RepID=UPI00138F4BFF|nr:cadherin-like beta sandwich domain-containing protein [Paenibacillus sp. Soil766]